MFRYFPTNYVWNRSVDLAIEMGARIGETEEMCAPLQEAAKAPDAAGTKAFRETWAKMADKLCALGEEDEARGRQLSAGEKYKRAASDLITCERLPGHDAPGRIELYRRELDLFARGIALGTEKCAHVHLDGVVEKIKVPFLVTHGEKDSQIPIKWAYRTYEQLVNGPKRELKIFTDREGGVQHKSLDNGINAGQYIADWVAETLGGRVA